MTLVEQRDTLTAAATETADHLRALRGRLDRKLSMPYPDGSRSDQVNASTDVLPILADLERALVLALDQAGRPSPAAWLD